VPWQRVNPIVVRHGRRQGGRAAAAVEERERHVQLARQRCNRYGTRSSSARENAFTPEGRAERSPGDVRRKSVITLSAVSDETQSNVHTVSTIGPDELPPPYQSAIQGGMPMVTCRVCQAMIDISGKRDQHVVKCCQCNEATVRFQRFFFNDLFTGVVNVCLLFSHSPYETLHLERSTYDVRAIVCSYARVLHSVSLVQGQIVNVLLIWLQALSHLRFYPCQACVG